MRPRTKIVSKMLQEEIAAASKIDNEYDIKSVLGFLASLVVDRFLLVY